MYVAATAIVNYFTHVPTSSLKTFNVTSRNKSYERPFPVTQRLGQFTHDITIKVLAFPYKNETILFPPRRAFIYSGERKERV